MIWWIFILSLSFSIISICTFIISPQSRYRIFPASQKIPLCLFLANLHLFPPLYKDFSGGSDGQESTCNTGDLGSIPGLGLRRRRKWQHIPVFFLENFMGSQRVRHNWLSFTHSHKKSTLDFILPFLELFTKIL